MPKRKRRHFSAEDKAAILRRHLADKVPVGDLCDEYELQPSVFYQWQRQLFDHAAKALEPQRGASKRDQKLKGKIETLEERLQRKDSVIAEISEEFVKLKKVLGGSGRQGRDPAGASPAASVARFRARSDTTPRYR